jgi:hypothetical protein
VKKYRVIFQGLIGDKEVFKARMVRLGAPIETVNEIIRKAPVVLKTDLTLGASRRYADAVQDAGGKVTIQENGHFKESKHVDHFVSIASFQAFTMCPECGFKQPKNEICAKCGFRFQPR